ncbi:glutathione S-transferase family protein [Thiocapsa sp.]|uniref:glutathione S-transferase family protein n=1 Tax=Thiocapsa sp. TaxID=2024551 RepID=UPI0025D22561|nr:glutathione S-transferase family protein [Thiocapsa sp.]
MTDLFAFGSAAKALDAEDRYGAAGDLKKTQYVMQLLGHPADADTLKCLIIAAEKGLEVETRVLDIAADEQRSEDYLRISPSGMMPALKEAHYQVCGDLGIVSFVEGRGLGNRMPPRNAEVLARQEYWVDIARSDAGPLVQRIVDAVVVGALGDAGAAVQDHAVADDAVAEARSALLPMLDALDTQLRGREYIIGPYSYADVHWTAYLHLLCIAGEGALIDARPDLSAWLARVRARKSFSGQDLVPYALLPSLEDIRANRLSDVVITDY